MEITCGIEISTQMIILTMSCDISVRCGDLMFRPIENVLVGVVIICSILDILAVIFSHMHSVK